jgi:two-component system, cell cycle response regulator DivK
VNPVKRSAISAWVLVVEDLRDQAELWSDVCAEAGLNVTTAATGEQGYRKARDSQPAVVLLDLVLPDIDGWDVCRRLKANDGTKGIPIVILTARDETHGPRLAKQLGCAAYLKKPCPPTELIAVLRRVLTEHQYV